ncbi:DMT family transporter [Cohnella lubricantis]|uniref:DMT family transporter n=1 Tax=Cohnella lubricantis TaxID=2163172 RepID=A0A841T9Q0_9BACL|nr:DMT family transporter [Cohnella lubricantis]MBB6676779.1 DMT family transporter [Cohnella lubricantis]MBP2118133.1 drug/metabolite transporter (DMT)-like permease [Cohnella lubricantis]
MNQRKSWISNLLLLLTACIWGFAFVAQRQGMSSTGPFTYNAVRFALAALSLIPLIVWLDRRSGRTAVQKKAANRSAAANGLWVGLFLFAGASLQQIGLLYTTAGKAAFVTGLYMVIVPFLGLFLKQRLGLNGWAGAVLALIGLYLLCVTDGLRLGKGDWFELIGAFFWAGHILIIDKLSRNTDPLRLSFVQIAVCSVLSFIVAAAAETIELSGLLEAAVPILYGGICSVGIAYTLQIIGQKNAQPTQAAIILSMETVFAAIGGYLILNELLGTRGVLGCLLMFGGMLIPQLPSIRLGKRRSIMDGAGTMHETRGLE